MGEVVDDVLVVKIDVVDVVVLVLVVLVLDVVELVEVLNVDVDVVVRPVSEAISNCDNDFLKIAKSSPWPFKVRPHSQKSLPAGSIAVGVASIALDVTSTAFT